MLTQPYPDYDTEHEDMLEDKQQKELHQPTYCKGCKYWLLSGCWESECQKIIYGGSK